MKIIYTVSKPIYDLRKHDADICIERNVTHIYHKLFTATPPDIIANIKWKYDSIYKNKQDYLLINLLHTYPLNILNNIITADLVYARPRLIRFFNYIGDECLNFQQLLDEIMWFNKIFKNIK
jgi:hypothetical protein